MLKTMIEVGFDDKQWNVACHKRINQNIMEIVQAMRLHILRQNNG